MADEKRYNLAQFFYNDTKIIFDGIKTTRKQEVTERTSRDDHSPYAVDFGKESFEWEASDIDQSFRKFFDEIMDNQKRNPGQLATISTYDYNKETGDLVEDDVFYGVWVEELSKENVNEPFSVKGGALSKKTTY